jgi:hypothetical protein
LNSRRSSSISLYSPIGNIPPAEKEAAYCRAATQSAVPAGLKANGLRRSRGGSQEDSLALLRRMASEELPAEIVAWSRTAAAAAAAQTGARLWSDDEEGVA